MNKRNDMYVISDYYKASRDVIAFVAGYYEKLFSAELLDQKISIQKWDTGYPMTVPKRLNSYMLNMDEDYFIFLHSNDNKWSQNIYQLAHEYSHVIMGCYPNNERLKWISECLCESASIHLLRIANVFFERYSPRYVGDNQEYLDDLLSESPTLDFQEISNFNRDNMEYLECDAVESNVDGRPRNDTIGKYWAKFINVNTNGWKAIRHFSSSKIIETDRFHFLSSWFNCCVNEDERTFVRSVAETIIGKADFIKLV